MRSPDLLVELEQRGKRLVSQSKPFWIRHARWMRSDIAVDGVHFLRRPVQRVALQTAHGEDQEASHLSRVLVVVADQEKRSTPLGQ